MENEIKREHFGDVKKILQSMHTRGVQKHHKKCMLWRTLCGRKKFLHQNKFISITLSHELCEITSYISHVIIVAIQMLIPNPKLLEGKD